MDVIDDAIQNGVSKFVSKGLEIHVDVIDAMTKRSGSNYLFSEDEKRERRNKAVLSDLDKYPLLKESFREWEDMGLEYGFSDSYCQDDKDYIKAYRLLLFEKDKDSPYTPEQRYYKLQKMYNQRGYELTKIREQLAKPIAIRNSKQIQSKLDTDAKLDNLFDLSNLKHVQGLLSIQQYKNKQQRLEFYPLYYMLKNENETKIDSAMTYILSEFDNVVKHTDLSEMERDITELIMGKHNNLVFVDAQTNPYSLIADYINKKYDLKKSKSQIHKIIDGKICKLLVNTYIALKEGIQLMECTGCHKDKLATTDNFSLDLRNTTGLKSKCKKCYAEEQRARFIG